MSYHIVEHPEVSTQDIRTRKKRYSEELTWNKVHYLQETQFLSRVVKETGITYTDSLLAGIFAIHTGIATDKLSQFGMEQLRSLIKKYDLKTDELYMALMYQVSDDPWEKVAELDEIISKKLYLAEPLPDMVTDRQSALNLLAKTNFLTSFSTFIANPQMLVDTLSSLYLDKKVGYVAERNIDRLPSVPFDEEMLPTFIRAIALLVSSPDQTVAGLVELVKDFQNTIPLTPADFANAEDDYSNEFSFDRYPKLEILEPTLHLSENNQRLVTFSLLPPFGWSLYAFPCLLRVNISFGGNVQTVLEQNLTFADDESDPEAAVDYSPNVPETVTLEVPQEVKGAFKLYINAYNGDKVVTQEINYFDLLDARGESPIKLLQPQQISEPESI